MRRSGSSTGGFPGPLTGEFRALAVTIVPDAASLDETGWRSLESLVDEALAARPGSLRRQFRLFIHLLSWTSVARFGRRLASLEPRRRDLVLASFERSRLLLLRRGFWGLRALVFLGYWTRPEALQAIGYRARPEGWRARR